MHDLRWHIKIMTDGVLDYGLLVSSQLTD